MPTAAELIDAVEPRAPPTRDVAVPNPTPVTQYSYGKSVGGPDESEDDWTNRGYSAGGRRNLTEGVAAVNPKKYPLGTVFRDTDSGKVFIASDLHGNKDPNVVDVFADPKNYQRRKDIRNFQVIDQIPERDIPRTPEGIQKLTAEYNRGTGTKEPLIPGQPGPPGTSKPKLRDWGIVTPGNIDIAQRPIVQNEDGSVSTLRSFSISDENGNEVLIPQVVDGEVVSQKEAVEHYYKTGEHLGKFKTPEQADAYAQRIHSEEASRTEETARHERLVKATERATGAIRTQLQEEGIVPVPRAELARTEKATLAKPKMTAAELLDAAEKAQPASTAAALVDGLDGSQVESKAQHWFLNAINSVGRGATSEGALMAAEGAYAMQEAGTKATGTERLFSDSAEKRKKFAKMRDAARDYLHVDDEFAQSLTGQILQGVGQLALLPLYAIPGVGEATSAAQLFQEAKDDYVSTMKEQGKEVSEDQGNAAATKYMFGAILPEAILNRFVLYRAFKPLIKAKKTIGQTAKTIGKMAVVGGGTEAFQQGELNYIAKELDKYDPNRRMDKEVVASLIVGGVVSGAAGTAGAVTQKLAGKERAPKPKTAAERQSEYEEKPGKMEEPVTLGATPSVTAAEQAAPTKRVQIPPNEDEALTAAEQRAKAGDVMGAKNALNRVGFFNEDTNPPENWDGTAEEWAEQRARNAAINKEIARRRKAVESATAAEQAAPFLEPETAELKSGGPAVTTQETRERSQYEPGSRESVEYAADKVGKKFPGLPRIEVADTFEQIRGRFPAAPHANLRSALRLPDGTVRIGKYGQTHEDMIDELPPAVSDKIKISDIGFGDAATGEYLSEKQAVSALGKYGMTLEEVAAAGNRLSQQTGGEYEAIRGGMASEELVKAQKAKGGIENLSEEPVIFDRNLNRIMVIRDNMEDVPPEALQEYITRLAMSQAAPIGGISNMVAGTPQADVYQQALLRAFPELSKVDFGSGFSDTFGYSNLGELMEMRELEASDPKQVAKAIEEHASNVASMAGEKPRWFGQLVSDVQAITGTMGMNLSPQSATNLIEKSQPATEEHTADTESRMDAARAARDNPFVVTDMSGRELYPDVRLAGLDDIKIVEMPELLRLFRTITGGAVPFLKKYRKALGMAYGKGTGEIGFHPDIFKDYVVAAKVAAHEVGHIIDFLATGKFSGLKGMAVKFPKMKETMREQLIELTHWWKPWDEGTAPAAYTNYRKNNAELFADGFSVLVNSPAELKKRAPMFYHAFFDYLQGHKNVGDAYFELMAELHKPHMELLRTRNKNERKAMTDGAELWMAAKNKQKTFKEKWRGLMQDFKDQYYWKHSPSERLQRKLERAGIVVDPALDLRTLFDEHPLADNSVYTFFVRLQKEVLDPLHEVGLTQQDLGVFLMHNRIMAGAYFDKAAPLGNNPKTSREQLALMRHEIGLNRWQVLEHHAARFHDYVFDIMKEAYMSGLISKETFTNVIIPNQHTYATFRPIAHVEDHMTAGLQTVTGFLDDPENPFFSTVLKMIAMRRAIQWNRAKNTSISFLEKYYPELKQKVRAPGKGIDPKPSDMDHGIIKVKEDGVWKYYEVPHDFAAQFKHPDHPSEVEAAHRFLHFIFRSGFYQTFVRFNPVFQFWSSPVRDIDRLYTNMPAGVTAKQVADEYLQARPAAKRRLKGEIDPIIMEMYETFAMSTPHDTFSRNFAKDDPLEMMMQEFHILRPAEKAAWRKNMLMETVDKVGDWIIFNGQVLEAAPKIAAYKILTRDLGWSTKRSAAYIRNYIGVPNYLKKGSKALSPGALMPFWNVALQGLNADLKLLRGREDMPVLNNADIRASQQGPDKAKIGLAMLRRAATWWLKFAAAHGIYALFQALAKEGLLGDDLEELFSGVGDYQHTNKMIIPLGKVEGGEFGYKSAFLVIPQDEMTKVVAALLKKVVHMGAARWKEEPHDPFLNEVMGLFGTAWQAIPGAHPLIKITSKWGQYAVGHNPYDEFRGRHILTTDQYLAGGWESIKPMMGMTIEETGITNFFKFNVDPDSVTEGVVGNIPILNRMVMISDQGLREKQSNDISDPKADAARLRLSHLPTETAALLHEYNGIRRLGKHRTPYQEGRFQKLRIWHKSLYKPTFDRAAHYRDLGGDPGPMLRAMEDQAERWKD